MSKILITLITLFLITGCEDVAQSLGFCECDYVVYDSDPTNNYTWTETYRSTWDNNGDCNDSTLSESTYISSSGEKYYSKTKIECD